MGIVLELGRAILEVLGAAHELAGAVPVPPRGLTGEAGAVPVSPREVPVAPGRVGAQGGPVLVACSDVVPDARVGVPIATG